MPSQRHNAFSRLFRGETSFDFAGRWKRWFIISGTIIVIGWISVAALGINFSIDFKGGTSWQVPTTASVSEAKDAISNIGGANSALRQATVTQLTDRETGKKTIEVEASAKETSNAAEVAKVTDALAKLGHTSTDNVALNDIGPTWGSDITKKAVEAVVVFLVIVSIFIWVFFEGKMAVAALTALVHDILITVGLYSISRFQVSPDTVIAFLTILGYSLYDTIVVFDRVRENTKGLAATGRLTYTDTVNLSMNQVLARSINTSFVAILPILSILVIGAGVLGASALEDFGLALTIGLTTGAYSSIFIASPLLALLKERETRYASIRSRLASRGGGGARLTPASLAVAGGSSVAAGPFGGAASGPSGRPRKRTAPAAAVPSPATVPTGTDPASPGEDVTDQLDKGSSTDSASLGAAGAEQESPAATSSGRTPTRPPPRPRKKGKRR